MCLWLDWLLSFTHAAIPSVASIANQHSLKWIWFFSLFVFLLGVLLNWLLHSFIFPWFEFKCTETRARLHAFAPVHLDSKWRFVLEHNAHGNMFVKRFVFALRAHDASQTRKKEIRLEIAVRNAFFWVVFLCFFAIFHSSFQTFMRR